MIRAFLATALVSVVAICASGCDALRAADPPNDPSKVPSSFGPCGSWVDCSLHEVIKNPADRCCAPTTACAVDDGGPYCAADENFDPSDPVTWGAKKHTGKKTKRLARSAHGE